MTPRHPLDREVLNNLRFGVGSIPRKTKLFDAQDFLKDEFSPLKALERAVITQQLSSALLARVLDDLTSIGAGFREQIESVQLSLSTDHASSQARIAASERALKQYHTSVAILEQHADNLVSYGRRVGLPFADMRKRSQDALRTATILENLVVFSNNTDVSVLPEIFHDDSRIDEAAEVVRGLKDAIESACNVDIGAGSRIQGETETGSLHNAYSQLILYLNVLDNRIVSHFDGAVEIQDVSSMKFYKEVMDRLHGPSSHSLLGSRYTSRNGIFVRPEEVIGVQYSATMSVFEVCKRLSEYMRHEVVLIEQVFGDDAPGVTAMFVTRLFEETLADFLEIQFARISDDLNFDSNSDTGTRPDDRENAVLICDATRKVQELAIELLQFVPQSQEDSLTVIELVEAAIGPAAILYEKLERRWHQYMGRALSTTRADSSPQRSKAGASSRSLAGILSKEVVLDLIAMNEESIQRCLQVKRPASGMIQRLFCSPVSEKKCPDSSLIDYVATYAEQLITSITEESTRSLATAAIWTLPMGSLETGSMSVEQPAMNCDVSPISGSFSRIVTCASSAAEIFELVNQHGKDIECHLDGPSLAATRRSLLGLQMAVEHHIAKTLQDAIDTLVVRIRDMLYITQQKGDFLVDASTCIDTETTTTPCQTVCAIISSVLSTVASTLSPVNMNAFSLALQAKMKEVLEQHILRYYFTRAGALRLKSELFAYAACLKKGALDDLIALTNVLIVERDQAVNEVAHGLSYLGVERVDKWVKRRT